MIFCSKCWHKVARRSSSLLGLLLTNTGKLVSAIFDCSDPKRVRSKIFRKARKTSSRINPDCQQSRFQLVQGHVRQNPVEGYFEGQVAQQNCLIFKASIHTAQELLMLMYNEGCSDCRRQGNRTITKLECIKEMNGSWKLSKSKLASLEMQRWNQESS